MSLYRPAKFPLLKFPFLCIECIVKSWKDIFDIISFALASKRTRRIVKILKIALKGIEVFVLKQKMIKLGSMYKTWSFKSTNLKPLFGQYPIVLQDNANPLYSRRTDYALESYTDGNQVTALKMAMEFLNDVFKCSVDQIDIKDSDFPQSFGVKSIENFFIHYENSLFGEARNQQLMLLLENLEVTGTCTFWVKNSGKNFYCDPKLFKCKELIFIVGTAAWVTGEILMQFEVPQLRFFGCPISVEEIVSFVHQWFRSDNKKLEYLYIRLQGRRISLEKFHTEELNPSSFNERNCVPSPKFLDRMDFSEGLQIVRHDGLEATIHVIDGVFVFYIWHNQ